MTNPDGQLVDADGKPWQPAAVTILEPEPVSAAVAGGWRDVPWRTIVAVIGSLSAMWLAVQLFSRASHVLVLVVVAGFFAVVLARPVAWLTRRSGRGRGLAIAAVVLLALATVIGLVALFVAPFRSDLSGAADMSGVIQRAADGEGTAGRLVGRLGLENVVTDNEAEWVRSAERFERSVPGLIPTVLSGAVAIVTVVVMTTFLLLQSSPIAHAARRLLPAAYRDWACHVARDAARAISGYVIGNLIISVCAGVTSFALLMILNVPNAATLALFVAIVDLVPLFGATIGAVACVLAAFLVSTTAGIVALVFFLIYQQFENNVLQVMVMSRTVQLNPLVVLLSVLLGVELFGILGALLAVPVAGAGLVIFKEVWVHRPGNATDLIVVTEGDAQPMTATRYRLASHLRKPTRRTKPA